MIFFIDGKDNDPSVPDESGPADKKNWAIRISGAKLKPWKSIYDDLSIFKLAILKVASKDQICIKMVKRFQEEFRLNIITDIDSPICKKLWDDVFDRWSSARTGNIFKSPLPRASSGQDQISMWNSGSSYLSKGALKDIKVIIGDDPQRAWRDQSRIFLNVTVAARSICGEVTSSVSKRIEKIYACQLCINTTLEQNLVSLINLYMKKRHEIIFKNKKNFGKKNFSWCFQYLGFYLPLLNKLSNDKAREAFLNGILKNTIVNKEISLGGLEKVDGNRITTSLESWIKLPLTVRCIILINDITRLDRIKTDRGSNTRVTRYNTKKNKVWTGSYPQYYLPKLGKHETGWTRNEYHETDIEYRVNLCSLWAGPSGHTRGNIFQWIAALGEDAPSHLSITIASSLFMFWRLYYDKRISGVHTLAETFEATFYRSKDLDWGKWDIFGWQPMPNEDAWSVTQRAKVKSPDKIDAIDPIKLMNTLILWQWPNNYFNTGYPQMKRAVNTMRNYIVEKGYFLPRWSHDTSENTGILTTPYTLQDGNKVYSQYELLTRT